MRIPTPANEAQRLQALHRYAILDTPPEIAFERITRLAARLLNVPFALVSFIDQNRQWVKSCYGLHIYQAERESAFCSYAILSDEVMVVCDTTRDPRFAQHPLVTSAPGIRFYAGAPLHTADGFRLGTLCIMDTTLRALRASEKATLVDLAAMVVDELELRSATAKMLATETARREEKRGRQLAEQRKHLLHVSHTLLSSLSLDAVIQRILQALQEVLDFDSGGLYWLDATKALLHPFVLVRMEWLHEKLGEWTIPVGRGVIGTVLQAGKAEMVNNAHRDPRSIYPEGTAVSCEHLICIPLQAKQTTFGVFTVSRKADPPFTDEEFELVQLFIANAAVAIENARLFEQIKLSEEKYRSLFEESKDVVFISTPEGNFVDINPAGVELFGYASREELLRVDIAKDMYAHPEDRKRLQQLLNQKGFVKDYESVMQRKDGQHLIVLTTATAVHDGGGTIVAYRGIIRDITAHKRASQLEYDRRRVLEMVAKNQPLPVVLDQLVSMVERQCPDMLCSILLLHNDRLTHAAAPRLPTTYIQAIDGSPIEPAAGSCGTAAYWGEMVITSDIASDPRWERYREFALSHNLRACWSLPIFSGAGQVLGTFAAYYQEPRPPDQAELELLEAVRGLVAIALEQRQLTDQLAYQAQHDALTGLPNRVLFHDRLQQALAQAQRHGYSVAVFFIDLDRFKQINDTLGHPIGDALLRQVAQRLKHCVRRNDTLARMGGDEFTLVLTELTDPQDATRVAQKFLDALKTPFDVHGHELFVTASIGISLYPQNGQDAATLQRNADVAMYRAKFWHQNSFQCFAPAMNAAAFERLALENQMRKALERGELRLHYQPQLDLSSGKVLGVEALLRWHHPELGLLPPAEFISVAEDSGLIVPIGTWVLQEACRQSVVWQRAGGSPIKIAVNVSALQFMRDDFVQIVTQALQTSNLEPHCLELELTESIVMHDVEAVVVRLTELAALGLQISIDDFGTGYSSLAYLQRLPINILKIDQSFVREIDAPHPPPQDAPIVRAITMLAHSLRLGVVAEGVETEQQLEFLCSIGCDAAQGNLFSKPLPAGDIATLLSARTSLLNPVGEPKASLW